MKKIFLYTLSFFLSLPLSGNSKYLPKKMGLTIPGSHPAVNPTVNILSEEEFKQRRPERPRSQSVSFNIQADEFPNLVNALRTPSPSKWGRIPTPITPNIVSETPEEDDHTIKKLPDNGQSMYRKKQSSDVDFPNIFENLQDKTFEEKLAIYKQWTGKIGLISLHDYVEKTENPTKEQVEYSINFFITVHKLLQSFDDEPNAQ